MAFILLLLIWAFFGGVVKIGEENFNWPTIWHFQHDSESLAAERSTWELGDHFKEYFLEEDQRTGSDTERLRRNAVPDVRKLWPNNTLIYNITVEHFKPPQIASIQYAMDDISSHTCVKFREKTSADKNWVQIKGSLSSGCSSYIGVVGKSQTLNLDPRTCFVHGAIVHEFLHALGFYHQHAAMERDDFTVINWDNIMDSMKANFNKQNNTKNFGVTYDYGSVMHYSPNIYSKNGLPTISLLQRTNLTVGQRKAPTASDILKLNLLYSCPGN